MICDLSIFNPKYLIVRIIITLTLAPPSTNISRNTDPLHSHSAVMAFKGENTFGTLVVDNPFKQLLN
jgi:hypothetical protein